MTQAAEARIDQDDWITMMSLNHILNPRNRSLIYLLKHDALGQKYQLSSRRFSTAAKADGQLPLAGIKVLDMTRVLAGVRQSFNPPSYRK
jgi:hypothetical protein